MRVYNLAFGDHFSQFHMFRILNYHPAQTDIKPLLHLAYYLLTTLPEDVAITVFQAVFQRILPIWLSDSIFQDVRLISIVLYSHQ